MTVDRRPFRSTFLSVPWEERAPWTLQNVQRFAPFSPWQLPWYPDPPKIGKAHHFLAHRKVECGGNAFDLIMPKDNYIMIIYILTVHKAVSTSKEVSIRFKLSTHDVPSRCARLYHRGQPGYLVIRRQKNTGAQIL